jgi:outer membrane lipoprotein-sorting protein
MPRLLYVSCAVLLALTPAGRADEAADARAVVDKAIKAHGGADNLNKHKAAVFKIKGKFYGLGEGIDFTGDISYQEPDKIKSIIQVNVMGTDFKVTNIVNGDKGWVDDPQGKRDMTKEELTEAQEALNHNAIAQLGVLTSKEYALSLLGEVKVGDSDAIGVLVQRKDRRDVSLFFDKKTYLLLKSETRVKDLMGGGGELTQETLYSDYKKIDEMQAAHKSTIKRDGKLFVESEMSDFKAEDKLDDSVFAKP